MNFNSPWYPLPMASLRRIFVLFFLFQSILYAQIQTGGFEFDGLQRNYLMYVPDSYTGAVDFPLVINLHGYGMTIQRTMDYTKMHQTADSSNFIFVYPRAIPDWNSGIGELPDWPAPDNDDVGFINALIDTLSNHFNIDLGKIYACGFSNGGIMSYKLACQLSHRIAAIASVAGLISPLTAATRNPLHTMPVLHIHGTNDNLAPIGGLEGWHSVDQIISIWTGVNDCVQVDTFTLPDLDPTDGCTVQKISFTNCTDNSNVLYFKVLNGEHTWPGADPPGVTTQDISASVEILSFFKDFNNPLVGMAYSNSLTVHDDCYFFSQDSVLITADLVNSNDNPVNFFAVIRGVTSQIQDTLLLFDDGQHGDRELADQLLGGYYMPELADEKYEVQVYCIDSIFGTKQQFHLPVEFYVRSFIPDILIRVQDIATGEAIEDCQVEYGRNTYRTDEIGETNIFCETCCGENSASELLLTAPGYHQFKEVVDITTDSVFVVKMVRETYASVIDRGSGEPIRSAEIKINGKFFYTNLSGFTQIELWNEMKLGFTVEHKDYFVLEDSVMTVPGDTLLIMIDRKNANIKFSINDEAGLPIADQAVLLVKDFHTKITNDDGIAFFESKPARLSYQYLIEKDGYLTIDSSLYLAVDTTVNLNLVLDHTGIRHAESHVRIYPSPAIDWITIQTKEIISGSVEMFSINGHQLYNKNLENPLHRINLMQFPKGIYFITIRSKDHVSTRKIVKL